MRQVLTVFAYTFRDAVRKKSFIVSTVIILLLTLALCALPRIIGGASEESETETAARDTELVCTYVDSAGLIPDGAERLQDALPDYAVTVGSADELDSYRAAVNENSDNSLVTVTEQNGEPFITVTTKDFMTGVSYDTVVGALSDAYIAGTLAQQGIGEDVIAFAQHELGGMPDYAGSMQITGYILGILITVLIFFAVYFYGYGVSMSVATEKTSRVMETLVVSAKPSRILIGKCLAMGLLGLLQFAAVVLFGALCYTLLVPEGFMLEGMPLTLSAFTVRSALLIALYFVLGYALYAMMNAVCGASVSKVEDLNSAMMPVMLIAMVSFYIGYFAAIMSSGEGVLTQVAMYVPFCAPFVMPFMLLNGTVATSSVILSVAIMLATIAIVTVISIKVYSASVLRYGKRVRLKDTLKRT